MKKKAIVILDNIRSVYNTASIFRTSDGVGVLEIFLCGTTPTPIDRFGRKRKDFAKVALGAEDSISWKYFETTADAIKEAKKNNFHIAALEQDERSIAYTSYQPLEKTALVLGEETKGLQKSDLDLCDVVLEIPMRGNKESLNVSVAAGIMLYQMLNN